MLLFLPLAPLAIIAIYSSKFLPIIGYMQWASLGIVFKALGWAISYQFIAKGDKKVFAINETVANIIGLVFDISGRQSESGFERVLHSLDVRRER